MINFIGEKQLKTNLSKFGITTFDEGSLDKINKFQLQVFGDLAQNVKKQQQKSKRQTGGRVAMPIQYFNGQQSTNAMTTFSSANPTQTDIRPETALNDPTGVLGTPTAMQPTVGGGKRFELSKVSAQKAAKQVLSSVDLEGKQQFVKASKEKFEDTMTEVLNKMNKRGTHLCEKQLQQVLDMKKFQKMKF